MRPLSLSLAALALVALAPASHAQLLPSVSFGVAGGPNFASLNDIQGATLDGSTGYHVGVYGDVSIPFVAFRTGVFYLSAGNVQTASGADVAKADFVTVPVDFRIQTPTPVVKAYVLAGPEFRFPIGSAEDVVGGGPAVDKSSINVAGNVGVGASFKAPLIGPAAFLELRYSKDITGFAQEQGLVTDNDYKVDLVQLRLGIGL